MSRPVLRASLLTAGVLLVQVAWILSLPPFRGIDEFDHAYRAAAVAHGQLLPSSRPVVAGRGDYVEVPASLVEAARPVCESYDYTGPDNCNAAAELPDGYVEVASAAARYNPVFYWLVGKPASLFSGSANVYALRVVAALLGAAIVWCAGYALGVGFRTAWPLLGAGLAMTPVMVYSLSLGAPNGVEMGSGLALWSALLALRAPTTAPAVERRLVLVAAVAAAVLATTRLLGPVWLVLVLAVALPFLGRARLTAIAHRHRWLSAAAATLVVAAVAAALLWTRLAAPNSLTREEDLALQDPFTSALGLAPLWVLQTIAAFPTRSEPAPTVVYATVIGAAVLLLAAASRRMPRTWWFVLAGAVGVWLGAQVVITTATYAQLGAVWQGRYALPFAVGVPVLLAALVDRHRPTGPPPALLAVAVPLLTAAHAVSATHVLTRETAESPLSGSSSWVTAPSPVIVLIVVVAGAMLIGALLTPGGLLAASRRRVAAPTLDPDNDAAARPVVEEPV